MRLRNCVVFILLLLGLPARGAFALIVINPPVCTDLGPTTCDLTSPGDTALIGGVYYVVPTTETDASGTGVIDPFLRLQKQGSPGVEQAYNTSDAPVNAQFSETDTAWTSDLTTADLATNVVYIGGVPYYEFVLDINQNSGSGSLLSLDQLQFFSGPDQATNATSYQLNTAVNGDETLGALSAVYTLDTALKDYSITLEYDNYAGSGRLDLAVYVPTSLFPGPSVYLYSRFGELEAANDGFEEWARKTTGTFLVPLPGTLPLLAGGVLALLFTRGRIRPAR
ncbi:MAG: hypothetical protein EHM59_11325 [Betaproteobacteria bacterium]|nr:MAG: hypothetical protein EHM59_11325 [Betaproteobacteria bacterium]